MVGKLFDFLWFYLIMSVVGGGILGLVGGCAFTQDGVGEVGVKGQIAVYQEAPNGPTMFRLSFPELQALLGLPVTDMKSSASPGGGPDAAPYVPTDATSSAETALYDPRAVWRVVPHRS